MFWRWALFRDIQDKNVEQLQHPLRKNQEIITNKAGGGVDKDLRKEIEDQINEDLKEINVEKIDKTDIIRLRGTV